MADLLPIADDSPYAGTRDIRDNPAFPGLLSRWLWQFYTHRMRPAGRWFLWPTIIFALCGSISLDLQAYVPFLYCIAVWIIAACGLLWARPRVTVTINSPARATAGETVFLDVRVTQTGRHAGRDLAVLPWRLPAALDAANRDGTSLPTLPSGHTALAQVGLICRRRGVFTLRGVRVQSDFPFGLLNAYSFYPSDRPLVIWPAFHTLRQLSLPPAGRAPMGEETLALARGDSFEPLGSRDYLAGDPVRWMDWRATARLGRPIVREWQQEETRRAAVVLDPHVPRVGWTTDARRGGDWERAVSIGAAAADALSRQGWQVAGVAAGTAWLPLPPGFGPSVLENILDTLAAIDSTETDPFAQPAPELGHVLRETGLVVCVFTEWDRARAAFMQSLVDAECGVKVVVVRSNPPTLDPNQADVPGGISFVPAPDWTRAWIAYNLMWNPFRSGPPKPMPPPVPFPWAAAGSAVVALIGLFITNGGIFVPVLIAAILLPGIWTRPRLDDEPVWVARLVLMGVVMTIGLSEPPPIWTALSIPMLSVCSDRCARQKWSLFSGGGALPRKDYGLCPDLSFWRRATHLMSTGSAGWLPCICC